MAGFSPGKIVYVGSFSKILSPHLRLGYIVAPRDTLNALTRLIPLLDRQGDQVMELATATFIEAGELTRHARRAIAVYRGRRDAFAKALAETFGDRVRFNVPAGGLAFWLEFQNNKDLDRIELYAKRTGLRLLRSEQYQQSPLAARGLRLGFASKTETEAAASLSLLHRVSIDHR
jgi:GntR family transcriptional regulator / MocR family aminotransferase